MAASRTTKSRTKARRRAAAERAADAPQGGPRDPLQAFVDEARILDSVLEGAQAELRSLHIPGRFGTWLAQFPVAQAGNDQLVREFTNYLERQRQALHQFATAFRSLPQPVRERLRDAGTGPELFSGLVDDARLMARPVPRRDRLASFLQECRVRVAGLLKELERQSERAYR